MKPIEVRAQLVDALRLDLVGPGNASELAEETLSQAPSRWYLTGFLVPLEASEAQRHDETAEDEIDGIGGDTEGTDDATTPEPAAARRAYFPSSIGLSLLVSEATRQLRVRVSWGDYLQEIPEVNEEGEERPAPIWRRMPREVELTVALPATTKHPIEQEVPESDGLRIALAVRPVQALGIAEGMVPDGTRSVSVFLVNHRTPAPDDELRDQGFVFQASLEVTSTESFIPRPNLRGQTNPEWDERVADLQYRKVFEFAVGHGIATRADVSEEGICHKVETSWIPSADVERVAPAKIQGVTLEMEVLAELQDSAQVQKALGAFVTEYRGWITKQAKDLAELTPKRQEIAEELLRRAKTASLRIEEGIKTLSDPTALQAFRLANRVMAQAARRRNGTMQGKDASSVDAPTWRPFQLAFMLMNLPGIVDPHQHDREIVDLLFFPTGGGKTEAYLGLAAFTLVHRRLKNPGYESPGLSVLMRYTLRLLTLDQLSRAATLICALELERIKDPDTLGPWPFEIGLWVGQAATPNRMGFKGDNDPYSARLKTIAFQNDDRKPAPIPIENCPWCGRKFEQESFRLIPNPNEPSDLRVTCMNAKCDFTRNQPLPLLAVDEPIYRRLPCFLIATVDKFAAMPWTGNVGAFFGRVDRYDQHGFYGPCVPDRGRSLPKPLLPPDLIIQDELHMISGPMGTMVGLYESALDELCCREIDGKKVRPKIIASTATVRRADNQIRALFNRREVDVFPPPGPDRNDSFFAKTDPPDVSHPRRYIGIAAQGRSLKVVMLRTYLALLGAGQKAYEADGGKRNKDNAADPYMTLLGYFNSLRELGGSRRIVEDEVTSKLMGYGTRKRIGQEAGQFASRSIAYEVVELTSRVHTNLVSEAKRRLSLPFHEKDRVDVAIATNMISVGLDITRLGLMVVLGQPKTCAEYIQATSRVGRDAERPGLVVTLFNIHRPRDRSHYERFELFHRSFYRTVEATSVTPFSPRALDRGLAGTLVALSRLGLDAMTAPKGATEILRHRTDLEFVVKTLSDRAASHAQLEPAEAETLRQIVRDRTKDLFDVWSQIAHDYHQNGTTLQYNQREVGAAKPLLREFLDAELKTMHPRHRKFRANRSMRDVEPSVNLWLRTMDNVELAQEDQE
ncbi:helicase [bacterium]|nr:helicase [bacterium]